MDQQSEIYLDVFWRPELTAIKYYILVELEDDEFCYSYRHFEGKYTRDELKVAMKELRDRGLVEFHRGLMNEDGEVAGSGFCRAHGMDLEIAQLLEDYDKFYKEAK